MKDGDGTKPSPDQMVWVHRRLAELTAFTKLMLDAADNEIEEAMWRASLDLQSQHLQMLSAEGVAQWQQWATSAYTQIREAYLSDGSDSAGAARRDAGRRKSDTLALPILKSTGTADGSQ